jgi:hypothetical protein
MKDRVMKDNKLHTKILFEQSIRAFEKLSHMPIDAFFDENGKADISLAKTLVRIGINIWHFGDDATFPFVKWDIIE